MEWEMGLPDGGWRGPLGWLRVQGSRQEGKAWMKQGL